MSGKPTRRTIKLKADIEYQIVWSKTATHWEIHRNGAKTAVFRRKKRSAIDRAIVAALSELTSQDARAVVTSVKEGAIHIEWVGKGDKRPKIDGQTVQEGFGS